MFGEMRASFPDLNVAVDKVVTDNDNIAIAYTLTGTHKGSFLGVAPTGRRISARGVQIARFEKGMLVERWGVPISWESCSRLARMRRRLTHRWRRA